MSSLMSGVFSVRATKLCDILLSLNTGKYEAASATGEQLVKTTPVKRCSLSRVHARIGRECLGVSEFRSLISMIDPLINLESKLKPKFWDVLCVALYFAKFEKSSLLL